MSEPTPTPSQVDEQQLNQQYDVKASVDAVRDAVLNAGKSEEEHDQSMEALDEDVPGLFRCFTKLFANYVNNQPGELDEQTRTAAVALVEKYGEAARDASFAAGARVLGGAVNRLAVALSRSGDVDWVDKTPDA